MDEKIAKSLIESFQKHTPFVIDGDTADFFTKILIDKEISNSSKFYETLPTDFRLISENNDLHYVCLRRIFRNKNAEHRKISIPKKMVRYALDTGAHIIGKKLYSSNYLSRQIRENKIIVDLMKHNLNDFALLAKIETIRPNKIEGDISIIRPVLVIPGAEGLEEILEWQKQNTIREQDITFVNKIRKYFQASEA